MRLGETIATYDVESALRGESGKFEITSPQRETYYITCKPNDSVLQSKSLGEQSYPQAFFVKKIAESVSLEQASRLPVTVDDGTLTPDSRAPFLLDNRNMEDKPSSQGGRTGTMPANESLQISSLDLFYSDGEAGTEQPAASVCLTREAEDSIGVPRRTSLTPPCRSFNDLDAEIRKLQAQLEDIRARAKKKFYKARAAVASA